MRKSLKQATLCFTCTLLVFACLAPKRVTADPIKVVVWDERQERQKTAYPDFLGNQIASYLKDRPGLSVTSVGLDDAEQGLSEDTVSNCDVLVWWGHVRQDEISDAKGKELVDRMKKGDLDIVILHSAHWSTPFVMAMNDRAMSDALNQLPKADRASAKFKFIDGERFEAPERDATLTPHSKVTKKDDGTTEITLHLPNCCFPAYRPDGATSFLKTVSPDHPIAKGIPAEFTLPDTEMYDEPFHVPAPDEVVFEERWEKGEFFRAGMVWNIGKGKLFYFRPGHETYKVFYEEIPLRIIENAIRWMGAE